MTQLYLITTLADRGVSYYVTDGDRAWNAIDEQKLPPGFVKYSELEEIRYVQSVATRLGAPEWVIERLKKFKQSLR